MAQVPDYTQGLSFGCTCGDTAYEIPPPLTQHSPGWCTGSLLMTLVVCTKVGLLYITCLWKWP